MPVRGIRGAITAEANTPEAIIDATENLLSAMRDANTIDPVDIASVLFSVTPDLNATFPARARERLGWGEVPLFCMQEMPVPESLPLCIRALLHLNTEKSQSEIVHVYLRGARSLRPDLLTRREP